MVHERWIDIETAKKLLKNVCSFLKVDASGVADFIIPMKEAVILSAYTGAFSILDENYKLKFKVRYESEPLILTPFHERYTLSEIIPIFSPPLSSYFQFFTDWGKPKYLFMVDTSKYYPPSYFKKATTTIYSEYYYELVMKKLIDGFLDTIRKEGLKSSDCLVWLSGSDGTYGEEFWTYVSGVVLRDKGYFVIPYALGGRDLWAYYIPEYLEAFKERGLLNKGAFIEELEMLGKKGGEAHINHLTRL